MRNKHDDLQALGDRLRDELSPVTSPSRRAAQQAALLEALVQEPAGRTRIWRWQAVAAVALVVGGVLLALVLFGTSRGQPLLPSPLQRPYVVAAIGVAQPTGDWLESHKGQLVVRFAGGSQGRLQSRGTVQILGSTAQRVSVRLVHGILDMKVKASKGCVWSVQAGSYQVTVVGTHFVVDWDIQRARLRVRVLSGRVRVEGPGLPKSSVFVAQGQLLTVEQRTGRYAKKPAATGPVAGSTPPPAKKHDAGRSSVQGRSPSPLKRANGRPAKPGRRSMAGPKPVTQVKVQPASRPKPKSWIVLYRRGRYKDAVKAADHFGFETLCRSLSASDLWRLARAARVTRKANHAASGLQAFRRRFPRDGRARHAAYLLGRVYLELAKKPASASRWFRTYVQESPRGKLHEEALGKYILTSKSAGYRQQAQRAAKQYLKRYPYGRFSNEARAVLKRGAAP